MSNYLTKITKAEYNKMKKNLLEGKPITSDPYNEPGDPWVLFFQHELNLSDDDTDDLLHDLNNLRGQEWIEVFENEGVNPKIIERFKREFKIDEDDEDRTD